MEQFSIQELEGFIVKAKAATYIGNGKKLLPYRLGSKDLQFAQGEWSYHDSYFGEANFVGEEVVYHQLRPVWGMNYMGYLLRPDLITAARVAQVLKESLSHMYAEGRFLGGFTFRVDPIIYVDSSEGVVTAFRGKEWIAMGDQVVYELFYHGGLIR